MKRVLQPWVFSKAFDPKSLVISRSFKLHRPRGYLCGVGMCPNCMMRVDGIPNVRLCTLSGDRKPVLEVQNQFSLLGTLGLTQAFSRLLKPGFQYAHFNKFRSTSKLFQGTLRRLIGIGGIPSSTASIRDTERVEINTLVIGGGISGLSAALKASEMNHFAEDMEREKVLIVDSYNRLGGDSMQRWQYAEAYTEKLHTKMRMLESAITNVRGNDKIRCLLNTRVAGYYENENVFLAISEKSTFEIKAKNVLIATGGHEVLPLFPNNDSPRVVLSLGAQMLMNHGVEMPGSAIVLDLNGLGPLVAVDLFKRGKMDMVKVARTGVFERDEVDLCSRMSVELLPKSIVAEIGNSGTVRIDSLKENDHKKYKVDLLVVCGRYQPNFELAMQLGLDIRLVLPANEERIVRGSVGTKGVSAKAVGSVATGAYGLAKHDPKQSTVVTLDIIPDEYMRRFMKSSSSYACVCEDVTAKDVSESIEKGFDYVESLKRYTGCLTGPCQGKQCALTVASMLWMVNPNTSNFLTTPRQPVYSVPLWSVASQ